MSVATSSAGDLGDVLMVCACLSELPKGPHTLILRDNKKTHGVEKHYAKLKRLIEAQPYIKSLELYNGQAIQWQSEDFRLMGRIPGGTLLAAHWQHGKHVLNSPLDIRGDKPWLKVKPDTSFKGKVIFARSPRYRNEFFPWAQVAKHYGPKAVFVGLEAEFSEFAAKYGYLPHAQFEDFYDLAAAIAGSDLFVGNQSFPNALNEALKHDSIQEVCLDIPDCLYARPNATYCFDGRLKLGDAWTQRSVIDISQINRDVVPPGGWQYPLGQGIANASSLGSLFQILRNNGLHVTLDDVLNYTAQRLSPEFYKIASRQWLPYLRKAFEVAGIPLDVP